MLIGTDINRNLADPRQGIFNKKAVPGLHAEDGRKGGAQKSCAGS